MNINLDRGIPVTFTVNGADHTVPPVTIRAWRAALAVQQTALTDLKLRVAAALCGAPNVLITDFLPPELDWLQDLSYHAMDDLVLCLTAVHEGLNPEDTHAWLVAERKKANATQSTAPELESPTA
jgi:hypothetical protein